MNGCFLNKFLEMGRNFRIPQCFSLLAANERTIRWVFYILLLCVIWKREEFFLPLPHVNIYTLVLCCITSKPRPCVYVIIVEIFINSVRSKYCCIGYEKEYIISSNTAESVFYFNSRRVANRPKIPIFPLNSSVSKTPLVQSPVCRLLQYVVFVTQVLFMWN